MFEQLFLTVPRGYLRFVIVVFPDHTHLLFFMFPKAQNWPVEIAMKHPTLQIAQKLMNAINKQHGVRQLFSRSTSREKMQFDNKKNIMKNCDPCVRIEPLCCFL